MIRVATREAENPVKSVNYVNDLMDFCQFLVNNNCEKIEF